MKKIILSFTALVFCTSISCSPPSNQEENNDLRINLWAYALGMTHNSHLNRTFSTESNSFSTTVTFEVYLSENTNYENIQKLRIVDDKLDGWEFDKEQISAAFVPDLGALRFEQLELRRLDYLADKILRVQILDEKDEVVFERGASINNDFPLPALSSFSIENESTLQIASNFYETPYDGGTIPFPIRIYVPIFSSSFFSVVWLDSEKSIITESFHNLGSLYAVADPNPDDIYIHDFSVNEIPDGSAYFYTKFVRGNETFGRALYTEVLELPLPMKASSQN